MVAVYRSVLRYRSSACHCYHLYCGVFPGSIVHGVRDSKYRSVYIKVARNFGIKQPELLFKIVLPAVFPGIASGLHIALGTAWIFLVTGEMVGSQTGLGFLIIDMRNNLRNDLLMVAILTIGFVGLLLDWGVSLIEKWIYRRWGIEK
jgi:NitT/TauT family transport system permease protein